MAHCFADRTRKAGAIGSALDAELDLYCDAPLQAHLAKLEDELRFVVITSYARVHPIAECPADSCGDRLAGRRGPHRAIGLWQVRALLAPP